MGKLHSGKEAPPSQQRPILVVEDDESIADVIEWCLTEEGYSVVTACGGQEALVLLGKCSPSLILLDMKMPGMDGWEFAAAYRQLSIPHAPIVVMTAAKDSQSRAQEIAAEDYIAKPFNVEHLLAVVGKHVRQ